ncbi:MAG: FCSD flavin-binding domain-containing protein [Burkholderiales bacterium]|nr:FCSD flavin-binding domain-containing protein [Burkholderiales bacterium]
MTFNRRNFLKLTAGGIAVTAFPYLAHAAPDLMKKKGQRVIIIGAGFGGATCAKYLRMWGDKKVEVVLIERSPTFISCPMSNTVLGGSRTMADITHKYDALTKKHGVKLLQGEVIAIDPEKQTVALAKGYLKYDRLIVAPGIDLMYDQVEGLTQKIAEEQIPHAWKAGPQTALLRKQLEAMSDGGVYLLSIPKAPYRCPPGPYERACQVAFYFKQHKPKSKVIVLDANPDITSKKGLFTAAWNTLYPGMIEYRPNAQVMAIDVAGRIASTEFDKVKADVLNIIPPMRAGKAADLAGVVNVDQRWCAVDFLSYESKVHKNIHIIGDAVSAALPKSGHMANSQAKVCAAAVIELLSGNAPNANPVVNNTCYSMVSDKEAMHVANIFRFNAEKQTMVSAEGGGVSEKSSEEEGSFAKYWAKNIWSDVLR